MRAFGSCRKDSTQANWGFLVLQNNSCVANYSRETSNPTCFQVAFIILKFYVSLCAKKGVSGDGQCHLPQRFHVSLVNALVSFETQFLLSLCHVRFMKEADFPGEVKD